MLEVTDEVNADDIVSDDSTSAQNVVTNDTFFNYFDDSGNLLDTVTSDELIFEGDFTGVGVNYITITHPIILTGKNAVFNGVSFTSVSNDITIDGFKITQSDVALFYFTGLSNITLSNNIIDFTTIEGYDGYAVYAHNVSNFNFFNNEVTFTGNTDGTSINNAILVTGDESSETISDTILVEGNTFDIRIPSVPVFYDPDTWESTIMSEGIVFYYCEYVEFIGNTVTLRYNNASGDYDTIYVISVRGNPYNFYADDPIACAHVVIDDNNITATGHGYIYGIFAAADDLEINGNDLMITSDDYYANGIDIEGPSNGDVCDNDVLVVSHGTAYGIYSSYYNGAVEDMTYDNNDVLVVSYAACGMELLEINPTVSNNNITAIGNYTYGIVASIRDNGTISENTISATGSNVGTDLIGDNLLPFYSMGLSVKGAASIENNDIESSAYGVNLVEKGGTTLDNNNITVNAVGNVLSYGIYAFDLNDLLILNNNITYVGNTDGTLINNAIRISGNEEKERNASSIVLSGNTIDISIPSVPVFYDPDTWEATIMSEGIVFYYCEYAEFMGNDVTLRYNNASGYYDTIYVVSVRGNPYNSDAEDPIVCAHVVIDNNNITATGHCYIYGIYASADGLEVSYNTLNIAADEYYANGIDIEGPSNGEVCGNNVTVSSPGTSYGIYSSTYNGAVEDMIYDSNNVLVDAYAACGMELIEKNPFVSNNNITATGNYTYGIIASIRGTNGTIINNDISCEGSEIGDTSTGDSLLPLNSMGISVKGEALVKDNVVESTGTGLYGFQANLTVDNNSIKAAGDYAIDLSQSNATVTNSYLSGKKGVGNSAISGDNVIATGNLPSLKTVLSAVDLYTYYLSGDVLFATAKDENGDPIKNATLVLNCGGDILYAVTDDNGVAMFMVDDWDVGEYHVDISYAGNDTYGPKSIKAFISISPEVSQIVAPKSATYLLTAVKKGSYYTILLKDISDNALGGEKVTITFNGKTYTYTTDITGTIKFKIAVTKVGTQKLTVKYESNGNYLPSTLTATIKINKEATKLTAKKKAFKAKVKTKKYTVTLKDSKGKAIKKAKLTLKIKGKTYKATTNAKGKAIFKIKKLTKKGTYKATVKFAGNNLYNAVSKKVKITVKK